VRARGSRLKFDRVEVDRVLNVEAETYSHFAAQVAALQRDRPEDDSVVLLERALIERFDFTRDRIFRLLGLVYPQEDIYNSWNAVANGRPAVRAAALEFLGNLLSKEHQDGILILLEASSPESVPVLSSRLVDRSSWTTNRVLGELIGGKDTWLAACAATLVGRLRILELAPLLEKKETGSSAVLREALDYAHARLAEQPR